MTTTVRAASWLYFSDFDAGDVMGRGSDHPELFTPLSGYDGDQMSRMGLGYVSLLVGDVEAMGIQFYGALDQYWADLIDRLPQALQGTATKGGFADLGSSGYEWTPQGGGLLRFDRRAIRDANTGETIAPAVSVTAPGAGFAAAIADGAEAWTDFCERVGAKNLGGPWMRDHIATLRAAAGLA